MADPKVGEILYYSEGGYTVEVEVVDIKKSTMYTRDTDEPYDYWNLTLKLLRCPPDQLEEFKAQGGTISVGTATTPPWSAYATWHLSPRAYRTEDWVEI